MHGGSNRAKSAERRLHVEHVELLDEELQRRGTSDHICMEESAEFGSFECSGTAEAKLEKIKCFFCKKFEQMTKLCEGLRKWMIKKVFNKVEAPRKHEDSVVSVVSVLETSWSV